MLARVITHYGLSAGPGLPLEYLVDTVCLSGIQPFLAHIILDRPAAI